MTETTIRIYIVDEDGVPQDAGEDFELSSFAGHLPGPGDVILHPGVVSNLDRDIPANRRIFTVVKRVFNPRDLNDYIVLMVEERQGDDADQSFIA